jgi:hypothetical protein
VHFLACPRGRSLPVPRSSLVLSGQTESRSRSLSTSLTGPILSLVVRFHGGHRHLPVVELKHSSDRGLALLPASARDAASVPSGRMATSFRGKLLRIANAGQSSFWRQIRTVRSFPAVTMKAPSCEAAPAIRASCPDRMAQDTISGSRTFSAPSLHPGTVRAATRGLPLCGADGRRANAVPRFLRTLSLPESELPERRGEESRRGGQDGGASLGRGSSMAPKDSTQIESAGNVIPSDSRLRVTQWPAQSAARITASPFRSSRSPSSESSSSPHGRSPSRGVVRERDRRGMVERPRPEVAALPYRSW